MPSLRELVPGDHVCWVVDDPATVLADAIAIELAGGSFRQRTVAFGPSDSSLRKYLTEHVSITADPWIDVLSRQRFEADAMYEMLRNQTAAAVADGYESLRLVADMDWLLPAELPSRR